MSRVTVDNATLASIHSLGVGASKDDVTPVITQIALKREGDALRAMTTDRYICLTGLYSNAEFEDWDDGEEMLIDPKALKSVIDIKKANKFDTMPVVIAKDADRGWVSAVLNSVTSIDLGKVSASFPPVMKLFPEGEPNGSGSLNIRPDFIAKLAKVLPPVSRPERDRIWSFEFRSIEDQPTKPQPVYARYHGDGYTMEALIQPALIKR
jgi:hypothetical protein